MNINKINEAYRKVDKSLFDGEVIALIIKELIQMKSEWLEVAGEIAGYLDISEIQEAVGQDDKYNIIGLAETPFHFQDVLDILDGTAEEKEKTAIEVHKIERTEYIYGNIKESTETNNTQEINIWSGYAKTTKQKELIKHIEKLYASGAYKINLFDDPDKLAREALSDKEGKTVTILPRNKINDESKKKIRDQKARVLFMNLKTEREPDAGMYEHIPLSAIIVGRHSIS